MPSAGIDQGGIQVTVQDERAAGAKPDDGVGYFTKEFQDKLKADFPSADKLKVLPFKPPSDKASCCFLYVLLANSYVQSFMLGFFAIFSELAGMVLTMDSAMIKVLGAPKNPFVSFDEERFNEYVNKYENGADYYAWGKKAEGMWLYAVLGALMFLVLMASTQIISEFTRRQWIYYELLQHGTLVDFKNREGHLQFILSVKLFWVIVLFTLLMLAAINCVGFQFAPTYTTLLLFWALHSSLKNVQEMENRLVNLNAMVDKRSRSDLTVGSMANEFLSKLVVIDETVVRYHIKFILLEHKDKQDKAQRIGGLAAWMKDIYTEEEYTELYKNALTSLDFGKLGRHGKELTKERYEKRAREVGVSTGCCRSILNCLADGGADFWASSLTPLVGNDVPMDEEATKKLKTLATCHYICYILSLCFFGVVFCYPLISYAFMDDKKEFPKECPTCECGSGSGPV